ncbi:autophagy-related protein 27-domain-containing protein [Trametes punicea]|nr:autophagy-related protein 27-domain-containing protein [Trametes punicea]
MLLLAALAPLVLACSLVRAAADDSDKGDVHKFRRIDDLTKQCQFVLGGQAFDLCPILEGNDGGWSIETERKTPPTVTKTSYRINLKGPLEKDADAPRHEQCPSGTWICQTITNRRPYHPDEEPRVLQIVPVAGAMNLPNVTRYHPGLNITAQLAPPSGEEAKHDVLHIRLHGGWYVYGPQKADIRFFCDHSVDEPSSPRHAWTWNGTHTFNWRTKQACGKQLSPKISSTVRATPTAAPDAPSDSEPVEDDAPPIDDETPEDDLTKAHPISGRASRSKLALLLSSFTAVLVLAYLAWFPPARVRQYVTRFLKAHPRLARFRVGEHVLVRWAYEDLELDNSYGYADSEEDVMVNFAPEADPEGIPLKPSPRLGGYTGYGTNA